MANYPSETSQKNEYKRLYLHGDALRDIHAAADSVLQISNDSREAAYVRRSVAIAHASICMTLDPALVRFKFLIDIEQFVTEADYEKVQEARPFLQKRHQDDVKAVLTQLQGFQRIGHLAHAPKILKESMARTDGLLRYQVSIAELVEEAQKTQADCTAERMQQWIDTVRYNIQLLEAKEWLQKMCDNVGGARTELIQLMIEHKLPAAALDMKNDENEGLPSFLLQDQEVDEAGRKAEFSKMLRQAIPD